MNKTTDFSSFTLEDFINHSGFVSWVLTPNEQKAGYWEQIKNDYPEKLATIEEARRIILSLQFETNAMSAAEQQLLWDTIALKTSLHKKSARVIPLWLRAVAAAVLLGAIVTVLFRYYKQEQQLLFSTNFGRLKTIVLPDGTDVTLNANSKIHYNKAWDNEEPREVWIDGEAFFKVTHLHKSGAIKPAERFIVHADKVNIEVLGTSFNVKDRRGLINVALINGKISLDVKTKNKSAIVMKPGEVIEYTSNKNTIIKKIANTAQLASWKNGALIFNNTPVSEIFEYIEDIYGYKATIQDPFISQRRLSGTFTNTNEDAFIKAISAALSISIKKDKGTHQLIVK